jgi:tRNA(fMet)-specific endonuclease VapC
VETFFRWSPSWLPFGKEDGEVAGAIRAILETSEKPIGAYDLLIAGQAMRNKPTPVTANLSEFSRVKELACMDLSKS